MIARWRTASANGVDQVVAHLARQYHSRGHEVEVWSLHPRFTAVRRTTVEEALPLVELPCRAAGFVLPAATQDFLRAESAHCAVAHLHSVFTPANISAAKNLRCPYVVSTHGGYAPFVFQRGALKKALFLRWFESAYLRRAAWLHAASEREKQDVLGVAPAQRIIVAPNGVNLAEVPRDNLPPPTPHRGRRLLSMGRLDVEVKGLDVLLAAFAEASQPEDRLALVGPDCRGGQQRLQAIAQAAGIADRIHFTGPLFGPDKWRAIAESDAVVQLSRWESMGQTVLEAMAAQRPVLVSPAIHYGDLITTHQAGWVAAKGGETSALRAVLKSPAAELARRGGNARRLVAECFSWESAAEKLLEAYATCQS
jgi:glycosyltransferase involved in cell wall biosynthesis